MSKNFVYVLQRGQVYQYSHTEWKIIGVYDTRKLAEQYVKKHENDEIKESEKNPDWIDGYEEGETYDYQITTLKIRGKIK